MKNELAIAERIKELRVFSDYSVEEMAQKLGISVKEYSSYETGDKEMPINLIVKVANILETEAAYIISGCMPTNDSAVVVYDGKGVSVERYQGYSFTSLAADFKNKQMRPMLVTIHPSDFPELVMHDGQEFNYVLEGELRVIVGENEYYLRAGDSIYFDPKQPHAQLAMGGAPAKFLTVING